MKNSKDQLMEKAADVFAANSGVDKLLYTADGNFFLPGKESFAKMHAKETKQELKQITKSELKASNKSTSKGKGKTASTAATSVKPNDNAKPADQEQNAAASSSEEDDSSAGEAEPQLPEISKKAQGLLDDAGVSLDKFLESQEGEVKRVTVKMVQDYINDLPK